jgi:hypothetical protein
MEGEGRFQKLEGGDRRSGGDRRRNEDRRGVQDWLDEEQQQERRGGKDRRSGISRRGTADNRQDERKVIPFAIAPRGSIQAPDGRRWVTTLWDLSRTGLCVIANGQVDLAVGTVCDLTLTEVVGTGLVSFQARLMWFSDDAFQTYLGMKFDTPPELPPGTFLERYLKANFD